MADRRTYLDNAATSFPKPEAVYLAVDRYQREFGNAAGRGATRSGAAVQRVIDQCRLQLARQFGAPSPRHVVFTLNGTDSLNLAIQGLLREGDRAIASVWDHNSVLRPLAELATRRRIEVEIIADDGAGRLDLVSLEQSVQNAPRLVVLNHASNVTGVVQPIQEAAAIAKRVGSFVLLDASQTAGHLPVHLQEVGVDAIAFPGHKGLLGPLGTGVLILNEVAASEMQPHRFGGTGTNSESPIQPESLPERFESGNLNVPGIFGLAAALEWRQNQERPHHEQEMIQLLIQGLESLPSIQVHCSDSSLQRVGVVSFSCDRIAPQVLSGLLDEHFGIETRAGLHCSPRAHQALGTFSDGGTVRVSVGPFTTVEEIDLTLEAIAQIVAAM
ncbi:aminotransferase class V-fold PLP-dependent enzyme [Planctomicrobium sp. SH668]|uniref:aminotransferase class V-fold PLP-dependent enzyme n=1 Tax=Planctomicrobium sp. SH668 TaxID=3448126 RepID=UPI003F5AFBBF